MTIEAKIILDSIAPNGVRITTSELFYPRFIHAELMTHRVFSRNAASSRAIPTPKKIERIRRDCAKPSEWGVNVKGMQSAGALSDDLAKLADGIWIDARDKALHFAEILCGLKCARCQGLIREDGLCYVNWRSDTAKGWNPTCRELGTVALDLHKQVANRILEPFDHICTVVTTTKLNNHRKLRTEVDPVTGRPMPDPTYFELATKWHAALDASKPFLVGPGEWHLPYVYSDQGGVRKIADDDVTAIWLHVENQARIENEAMKQLAFKKIAKMVSVGRVARTSYMRSGQGDIAENVVLHDRLASAGHWSPFEAQATPIANVKFGMTLGKAMCDFCNEAYEGKRATLMGWFDRNTSHAYDAHICMKCALGHVTSGNFVGFKQYRKEFPGESGGDD